MKIKPYPSPVTVSALRKAIKRLPSDLPIHNPNKWYITQKQHWLGWLNDYPGSGAYGRRTDIARDARYAYNHIVEVKMLLWLAEAIQLDAELLEKVRAEIKSEKTLMGKSGKVRQHITWDTVAYKLWPNPEIHSQTIIGYAISRAREYIEKLRTSPPKPNE